MKVKIEQRLKELQTEHEAGERMLTELTTKRTALMNTLLRIEGAIQALREVLVEPTDGKVELIGSNARSA
jgi:hypothetical protein